MNISGTALTGFENFDFLGISFFLSVLGTQSQSFDSGQYSRDSIFKPTQLHVRRFLQQHIVCFVGLRIGKMNVVY
jgi:hypothetical protein